MMPVPALEVGCSAEREGALGLKLPAYRRLLAAYTLNELGVADRDARAGRARLPPDRQSRSARRASSSAAQFVPALIAPLVVGRLDRLAARRVLPALYALEAVAFLLLGLARLAGSRSPRCWCWRCSTACSRSPRARSRGRRRSRSPSPAGLLREGNALTNAVFSVCFMLGPAIGGAVVVAGGTAPALLVNAGLFVVDRGDAPDRPRAPARQPGEGGAAARLRSAVRIARSQPAVRTLLAVQALAVLVFFDVDPGRGRVRPAYAARRRRRLRLLVLGLGGGGAGRQRDLRPLARFSAADPDRRRRALLAAGFALMAAARRCRVALAGAALAGIGNGVEAVAARTALQEQVEQRWMALIMSLNESLFRRRPGFGILLGGALTAIAGPRVALAVGGVGSLAIVGSSGFCSRGAPLGRRRGSARGGAPVGPLPTQRRPPGGSFPRGDRLTVRRACIDIGSNTTRLLVAECGDARLLEVHQERAFTRIGRALRDDGAIAPDEDRRGRRGRRRPARARPRARRRGRPRRGHGGDPPGAQRRRAGRGDPGPPGLEVRILSGEEEARLAFVGAARTLGHVPRGALGVVDVGGGSSELVVGTAPDRVSWSRLFGVGSGDLAEDCLRSDPPSADELARRAPRLARR